MKRAKGFRFILIALLLFIPLLLLGACDDDADDVTDDAARVFLRKPHSNIKPIQNCM